MDTDPLSTLKSVTLTAGYNSMVVTPTCTYTLNGDDIEVTDIKVHLLIPYPHLSSNPLQQQRNHTSFLNDNEVLLFCRRTNWLTSCKDMISLSRALLQTLPTTTCSGMLCYVEKKRNNNFLWAVNYQLTVLQCSASLDKTIRIWDMKTAKCVKVMSDI